MTILIEPVSCFETNYCWVLYDDKTRKAVIVDPGHDTPVLAWIKAKKLSVEAILITHFHSDHTGGIHGVKATCHCRVFAPLAEKAKIGEVTEGVKDGDVIDLGFAKAQIMATAGHTMGSVCYYFPALKAVFTGDTLFSLGCGRLFEGTPQQMYESLQKIKSLPPDTWVYAAHEYTQDNGRFALTLFPDNSELQNRYEKVKQLRSEDKPTLPVLLSTEIATNPFLLAGNVEEFTKFRRLKDQF